MKFSNFLSVALQYEYLEGKQQAVKFLEKYGLSRKTVDMIIKDFEGVDPTYPKNKYYEILCKMCIEKVKERRENVANEEEGNSVLRFLVDLRDNNVPEKLKSIEDRKIPIDLSKIRNYKQFIETINELSSIITKSVRKLGLTKLKKNHDYLEIPLEGADDTIKVYIPLNYNASKIIASDKVGVGTGEWCTAYQKTQEYWDSYIVYNEGVLVYIVNFDEVHPLDQKQAIYFYEDGKEECFAADDSQVELKHCFFGKDIKKYVRENWGKIREFYKINDPKPSEFMYMMSFPGGFDLSLSNKKLVLLIKKGIINNDALPILFRDEKTFDRAKKDRKFTYALKFDFKKLSKEFNLCIYDNDHSNVIWSIDDTRMRLENAERFADELLINKRFKEQFDFLCLKNGIEESKLFKIRFI